MPDLLDLITPSVLIGGLSGLLGALRAYAYAKRRDSPVQAFSNVLIGTLFGAAAAAHFIDSGRVLTAIPLGVLVGSVSGYTLDTLVAVLPSALADAARAWLMGWASRQNPPPPDPPPICDGNEENDQ